MDRAVQLLINAGAMFVAVWLVPGLEFDFAPEGAWIRFLLVAFIFGLVNTFVRPVLQILTFPITMVTLGLFLVVINALMLLLTQAISNELSLGLTVADFLAALLGALVISIVGFLLSLVIGTGRKLV